MQFNLDAIGRSVESLKMTLFWLKTGEEIKIFPHRLRPALMRVSSARERGLRAIDSRFGSATAVSVGSTQIILHCPSFGVSICLFGTGFVSGLFTAVVWLIFWA